MADLQLVTPPPPGRVRLGNRGARAPTTQAARPRGVLGTSVVVVVASAIALNSLPIGSGPTAERVGETAQVASSGQSCVEGRTETGLSGGVVPAGPRSIRLCQAASKVRALAPTDVLTTGLDRVVETYNASRLLPARRSCTADLGPEYLVVFEYADRPDVVVRGELYGCRELSGDPGRPRSGADTLLAALNTAWKAQRDAIGTAEVDVTEPPSLTCPTASTLGSLITVDASRSIAALACVQAVGPAPEPVSSPKPIDAADLAVLKASLATGVTDGYQATEWTGNTLVLADAWGGMVTAYERADKAFDLPGDLRGEGQTWTPNAEAHAVLERLFR